MSYREPVMKHFRGQLPTPAPLGAHYDPRYERERLLNELMCGLAGPVDLFSEETAQTAFVTPERDVTEQHSRSQLEATGPLVWPRKGRLFLRLENPNSECVQVDVRVYDLRRDFRDILRIGPIDFRKTIKLAAFHTGTVSFEPPLPGGWPIDVSIRSENAVLPLLQLHPLDGPPQTLYRSCDFVPLNRN